MATPAKPVVSIPFPAPSLLPILIIAFTALNGLFNSLATAFGYGFPFDTFCFTSQDLFADFVKAVLSYPGPAIRRLDAWPALYRDYFEHNPYGGVEALSVGKLSNLHGMPLPTFIALEARRALAFRNPNFVTFAFLAGILAPFSAMVWFYCRRSGGAAVLLHPGLPAFLSGPHRRYARQYHGALAWPHSGGGGAVDA